jgi:hypothetical protein
MKKKSFVTPLLLLITGCAVGLSGFWASNAALSFWMSNVAPAVWVTCELALVAAAVAVLASEVLSSKRQRRVLLATWVASAVAFAALSGMLLQYLAPKFFIACGAFIAAAFVLLLLMKIAKTAQMKTLTALTLCYFLAYLATFWLRGVDIWLSASVGCGVFFCFTLLCLNRLKSKLKGWQVLLAVLLGFLVMQVAALVYSKGMLIVPPDDLFRLAGGIAGLAFYRIRECWRRSR